MGRVARAMGRRGENLGEVGCGGPLLQLASLGSLLNGPRGAVMALLAPSGSESKDGNDG